VRDLLLLGTPLSAISLAALIQPTADALRLLRGSSARRRGRARRPRPRLGRALVNALMELAPLADPAAELRQAVIASADPRAGLTVTALFGEVADVQIARAMTAIVASGLARRAQSRADAPPARPAGVAAGLRWVLPDNTTGTVAVTGRATLALFGFDDAGGARSERVLRIELRIADRLGWLAATPDLELRAISADLALPFDGAAAGSARIVLHDARVFGQSFERLVIGNGPTRRRCPEARVLLAAGMQRVTADLQGSASLAREPAERARHHRGQRRRGRDGGRSARVRPGRPGAAAACRGRRAGAGGGRVAARAARGEHRPRSAPRARARRWVGERALRLGRRPPRASTG
jgi:hypothetical protein